MSNRIQEEWETEKKILHPAVVFFVFVYSTDLSFSLVLCHTMLKQFKFVQLCIVVFFPRCHRVNARLLFSSLLCLLPPSSSMDHSLLYFFPFKVCLSIGITLDVSKMFLMLVSFFSLFYLLKRDFSLDITRVRLSFYQQKLIYG